MERVFPTSPRENFTETTVPEPSSDVGNKPGQNFFPFRPVNDLATFGRQESRRWRTSEFGRCPFDEEAIIASDQ